MNYVENSKGRKPLRGREKFYYINGDYSGVIWIQIILLSTLEEIFYLYKLCLFWKG